MRLSDFDYNLPKSLIAQKPLRPRDSSRLLVLDRNNGEIWHKKFSYLPKLLSQNDVLVFNDSKVIPARLYGQKETGGRVETLLIRDLGEGVWRAILGNFKEREIGKEIIFSDDLRAKTKKFLGDGLWEINFNFYGKKLKKKIYNLGFTPLPPYIKKDAELSKYQTIYAQKEGSSAAPTAGFHFTGKTFTDFKKKKVKTEFITLHVGLGTFLPVKTENIKEHKMHSEVAQISKETAQRLNQYKKDGRRIIAVGTTTVRTLESFADKNGYLKPGAKETDIFITPGYQFKFIDALITNFHLPKSTLLMLVCSLAGRDKIFKAYNEAVKKNYRFYSFGDSMFIK